MGIRRFFRRRKEDSDLARELEAHIAHQVDENISAGMSEEEARRQAYLKLGSPQNVREHLWRWNTVGLIEDFLQDLRYGLRTLWRMPGFALVALLTLALGSGATTVMFTVINGVLLKPLPYAEPDKLVTLQEKTEKANQFGNLWSVAYPNFLDCKNQTRSLMMAAWRYSGGTISGPGDPEYVDGFQISSELFSILGVRLNHGRVFLPEEDRLGAAPVIIISDGLWRRRFGAGEDAIGKPLVYDEKTYSVVGIAPPGFRLNGDEADVFTPLGQDTSPVLQNRERHAGINAIARLRPGATLSQARSELALIGLNLAAQYPDIQRRPHLRGRAAARKCRRRKLDAMVAAGRCQPGAADRMRQCSEPFAGSRRFTRTRVCHACCSRGKPRPRDTPMPYGERNVGACRRVAGGFACCFWHPPICYVLARHFTARRGNTP